MNTDEDIESAALIESIAMAFDGCPGPGRVSLRVARARDDYVSEAQLPAIRKLDLHVAWQEVRDEELEEFWDVHPFLDGEAFRFYLPCFMTWSVRNYACSDIAIGQWTLAALWLEPEKLRLLDAAQRQVIVAYLLFAAKHFNPPEAEEARRLYDQYWWEFDAAHLAV